LLWVVVCFMMVVGWMERRGSRRVVHVNETRSGIVRGSVMGKGESSE